MPATVPLRMLDLFSGREGASRAMREHGWFVCAVEIEERHKPDVIADVRALPILPGSWDLLWASPPCVDYARNSMPASWHGGRWKKPHGEPPDLSCWQASLDAIERLQPTWWVIENVQGAVKHWGPPRFRFGSRYLWSNIPLISDPGPLQRKRSVWGVHPDAASLRAEIPYQISAAVCCAVEALS